MAETEKSIWENITAGPSSWPEAYFQMRQLIGARGAILLLAVAVILLVWWKWEDIAKRPGVNWVISRFRRKAIPLASVDHLTIAVARLANDKDREHETLLVDELGHFEGVETRSIGRAVGPEGLDKKKAEEEARGLLKKTGADVLIWGSVITLGGKSAMRLYWTLSREVSGAKGNGKYQPLIENTTLPPEFWSDLKQILGLLTQSRLAELIFDRSGHYIADRLAPLIAQVRTLAQSREGVWNPDTLAAWRAIG
jgi:hypothetical protein